MTLDKTMCRRRAMRIAPDHTSRICGQYVLERTVQPIMAMDGWGGQHVLIMWIQNLLDIKAYRLEAHYPYRDTKT